MPLDFTISSPLTSEQLARLRRVFGAQLADGSRYGAQWVIVHHGQVVADFSAGLADVRRQRPVTPQTVFLAFSVTKPLVAMCIHQLAERRELDLDAPIATYWPEFGRLGKEQATVRHTLTHQAGIPLRGLYQQIFMWPQWERAIRHIEALPAEFAPGTQTAYHLVNYGFILGEVVRRVSGQPIEDYLRAHFLEPLGMADTQLFLPDEWTERAAQIYSAHPQQHGPTLVFSQPAIRRAVVPAASLNTTARDLAVFFQMLLDGGVYAEQRYLQPETIQAALTLASDRYDTTMGYPVRWALGFHLGGSRLSGRPQPYGWRSTTRTFGHIGQGSTCMAWADPDQQLVVAFTSNRLQPSPKGHAHLQALSDIARVVLAP